MLYAASTSKILVNGYESETVHLGRGVRQGCPLSPFLFLFAIETLACLIRSSSRIQGIRFGPELWLKVALYADDTTLLLSNTSELREAERLLALYEKGSGVKVNAGKSELLPHTRRPHASRFALWPISYKLACSGRWWG